MSVQLNILCQNFINLQYPQNCIEFDNDTIFAQFLFENSKTNTISNTYG